MVPTSLTEPKIPVVCVMSFSPRKSRRFFWNFSASLKVKLTAPNASVGTKAETSFCCGTCPSKTFKSCGMLSVAKVIPIALKDSGAIAISSALHEVKSIFVESFNETLFPRIKAVNPFEDGRLKTFLKVSSLSVFLFKISCNSCCEDETTNTLSMIVEYAISLSIVIRWNELPSNVSVSIVLFLRESD